MQGNPGGIVITFYLKADEFLNFPEVCSLPASAVRACVRAGDRIGLPAPKPRPAVRGTGSPRGHFPAAASHCSVSSQRVLSQAALPGDSTPSQLSHSPSLNFITQATKQVITAFLPSQPSILGLSPLSELTASN